MRPGPDFAPQAANPVVAFGARGASGYLSDGGGSPPGYPVEVSFACLILAVAAEDPRAAGSTAGRLLLILLGSGLLAFLIGLLAIRVVRHAASPTEARKSRRRARHVSAWEEAGRRAPTPPHNDEAGSDGPRDDNGPGPWGAP